MKINKRRVFFWLKIIIIIYFGSGIALYYLQGKFLFHPEKLPANYVFKFNIPFKEISIPVNETDTISVVKFFPAVQQPKGVIIYFHGNMHNVEYYAPFVPALTKYGYEVWMPDYPGYGKSTGERNENKLYKEAWLVHQLAMKSYHSDSIIIYGRSLGTGIAAYTASATKCSRLILETPYYSIPDLFSHYAFLYPTSIVMGEYKLPTGEFLKEVEVPVTIFHGTNDRLVPYSCAVKLKRSMKPGDQFITIEEGKHNDLITMKEYQHVMDSLLNR